MPVPVVVPRAEHRISRRDIDPDALRVLYRLHEHRFAAYLVGGSVRDLLLGRKPKDFDVGTDAHPYQIKRLFRNCWIIGRRFRLAHVKFGLKTIEVATFRRIVTDAAPETNGDGPVVAAAAPDGMVDASIIHRDNTFGTPEEDAFRRDFTINGLFYDIGTFSVIDYVGGLEDLACRTVRSIGDPRIRFVEDPVRMLRAVVMAVRLGFDMDPLVIEAIAEHRGLITKASPARLLEEYYKILRSGYAEATFRALGRVRLLELMTPELKNPSQDVWESLGRLDRYRRRFSVAPPELTTTILCGSLLVPLGALGALPRPAATRREADGRSDRIGFGILPIARKDVDRLRQIVQLVPRLLDTDLPPRVARSLAHRPAFDDALVWLSAFHEAAPLVERWREVRRSHPHPHSAGHPHPDGVPADAAETGQPGPGTDRPRRRRRRRRRGRGPKTLPQ